MSRLPLFLVIALVLGTAAAYRRVCYYTNWAQYRNGPAKFFPENVDPSLCTHLIYSFAKLAGNHLAPFEWNDESTAWSKGMYERFSDIKKTNPGVKTLLAVGGWNLASAPFTQMVATDASRKEFARTTVTFLRKNGFDGLDLDWEYPANRGSPPQDRDRYTQLIRELRSTFDAETVPAGKQKLMISAAVAAGKDKIDTAYDVPAINGMLDMINLMTYDLHGSWEDHTGHNSPLYARAAETGNDTYLNVDWAAKYWVSKGASKAKMNIGMPLYGRTFKLPSGQSDVAIGCNANGAGPAGQYTREAGFMSYYEICTKLANGATRMYDSEGKVPYLAQNGLWVGYDDKDSLKTKVDYVKQEQYGGIMVWALDLDDFSGSCGEGKYPLLRSITQELESNTGPQPTAPSVTVTNSVVTSPAVTAAPVTTKSPSQSGTTVTSGCSNQSYRRVCYYTNWAQYRNGPAKFMPENVDPSLCSHIIYSFAKLVGNHLAAFEWNDESTAWSKGMYERFQEAKATNPNVKSLLAVGGWNMGSAPFTKMAATDASRKEFARTTVAFLRKNGFDGLDLDWEYPANRGSPAGDREKFTLLVQELRSTFDAETVPAGKEKLMLSAAVAAGKDKIDTAYNVPALNGALDMINLMTYDLHGSWEDHTGHNSPLYARSSETGNDTYLNVDWAAQYWVSKGASKAKMNIGMPLYGRTFNLPSGHTDASIGSAAHGAGPAGQYTREAGFMAYYEICSKLARGATRMYDAEGKVPYMVENNLWVGYDDKDSLKAKVDYVKQEGFGGAMVWALDLDDFSGSCGDGKYPLLNSINQELQSSTGCANTVAPATTKSPSVTNPPMTNPPATNPPMTNPPMTNPPATNTPVVTSQSPIVTQGPVTTKMPVTTTSVAATTNPTTAAPAPITTTVSAPSGGHHHDLTMVTNQVFDCSSKADGYYPSPTSCTHYYICAANMAFRTDCHPGLVYNPDTQYCDFSDHVSCGAQGTQTQPPAPVTQAPVNQGPVTQAPVTQAPVTQAPVTQAPVTQAPVTQAPVTQAPSGPVNPLDFCKGKTDGFYRDPTDCTHFYQCSFGLSYHEPCGSGTYYSEALQGCDWAANVPNCP